MVLTKKDKTIRLILVISLLLLIFLPAQMPLPEMKIGAIAIFGILALVLQLMVFRQTDDRSYRTQSVILMVLTIAISAILIVI